MGRGRRLDAPISQRARVRGASPNARHGARAHGRCAATRLRPCFARCRHHELAKGHRLQQPRLAHEGLVEQIAITSSRIPARSASRSGDAAKGRCRCRTERLACSAKVSSSSAARARISCSVSNSSSLPRSPSSRNRDSGGAPAHRAERVEAAGRVASERLLEQGLGLLRQVGQRKIFARPLDLGVIAARAPCAAP